jgi:hypothetical protein
MSKHTHAKSIFTSYGTLRASILEVQDLLVAQPSSKVKSNSNVFAVMKVAERFDSVGVHFHTETRPCYTGEVLDFSEEFIFESISSAHTLYVSFYLLHAGTEKTEVKFSQVLLGMTEIPVSRLEENRTVMLHCSVINFRLQSPDP